MFLLQQLKAGTFLQLVAGARLIFKILLRHLYLCCALHLSSSVCCWFCVWSEGSYLA